MLTSQDKKNSLWNTLSFVISSLLNFLNYSLIYKTFDLNVFGFFILISSIFGIGASLDFGFGISTIKNIAEAKKKNDLKFIDKYFTTFFLVFLITGLIIVIILFVYCIFVLKNSELLEKENVKNLNFNLITFLMIITFIFNYNNGYLKCTLEGFSEYVKLGQINILSVIFNTILFTMILIFNLDIYYLVSFITIVSVFSFLITFYYIFFYRKLINFKWRFYDFSLVKKYSQYGINIQIASFLNSMIDVVIKYLIGLNLSFTWVSYFESGKKIINFSSGIIFSTQRGLLVKLSEENIVGNLKMYLTKNLYYFSKMSNYYSIIIYGIMNPLICFFILFWFNSYESMLIYLIFSLSYSFINFGGCLYAVLMIEGKGLKLLIIQTSNLILTYVMLGISLSLFNNVFGLFGYYLSILISIIIIFHYLYKSYGFDFKSYLKMSELYRIVILNFLIFIQIMTIVYYQEELNYILVLSFIIFSLIYIKQFVFILKLLYQNIQNKFSY